MNYVENAGAWIVGGIGSIYAFVTGSFDTATVTLFAIMLMDLATGILKGLKKKNLKSAIMSVGILKKGAIILAIVFSGLLDALVNNGMPVFVTMMTWLTIGNETLSVIENFSALGVHFPKALTKRFGQVVNQYKNVQDEKEMSSEEIKETPDDDLVQK